MERGFERLKGFVRWVLDTQDAPRSGELHRRSFWRVAFGLVAVFTAFWLCPAIIDWLPRALRGHRGSSFPRLAGFDKFAYWISREHMWLLCVLAFANVIAVAITYLAARNRAFATPVRVYAGIHVLLGPAILFSDCRLYVTGVNAGEDAFVLSLMWLILALPLWLLCGRAMWELAHRHQLDRPYPERRR